MPGLISLQQDWLIDIARDYAEFNKRFGEVLHEMAEQGTERVNDLATDAVRAQKPPGNKSGLERAAA